MAGPLGETTPGMVGYTGATGYDPGAVGDTVVVIGNTVASQTLDLGGREESSFDLTLHVATTTLAFTNPASAASSITLLVRQDTSGARVLAWPASVKWAGGAAPTITVTASAKDLLRLDTMDGGVTWFGRVIVAAAA